MTSRPMIHERPAYLETWQAAQAMPRFTVNGLVERSPVSRSTADNHVKAWERRGLIREVARDGATKIYSVTEEGAAVEDPRTGDPDRGPRETQHGNMWLAMRKFITFTPRDLAAHASTDSCPVDEEAAKTYCRALVQGGYLRVERKALPGRREAIYKLVKNTGPRPPRERRVRAIYDENIGEFTHIARGLS